MAEVALVGVTKRFRTVTAVNAMSCVIADGEFFVLLGPTGAGKTTTLRLVAGLEKPDAGRIAIGGHDVTAVEPPARDIAFVFQQYSLYPHLSAYDNLAFPLRSPARRVPEAEIRKRISEIAEMLRISAKLGNRATISILCLNSGESTGRTPSGEVTPWLPFSLTCCPAPADTAKASSR